MSTLDPDVAAVREALDRLYVNVRAEYPFSVRDKEIVEEYLDRLSARLQEAEREREFLLERVRRQADRARTAEAREAALRKAAKAIVLRPDENGFSPRDCGYVRFSEIAALRLLLATSEDAPKEGGIDFTDYVEPKWGNS